MLLQLLKLQSYASLEALGMMHTSTAQNMPANMCYHNNLWFPASYEFKSNEILHALTWQLPLPFTLRSHKL